jgi:hypothetical protein
MYTRPHMNIASALAFVAQKGSALEQARLQHALFGAAPGPEVIRFLDELQNADGGFACGQKHGDPSALNDTLLGLWRLDDLGMLATTHGRRAIQYLLATQQADGGWDEVPPPVDYSPPPWAVPGDLRARLYLSAYAAYWLALAPQPAQAAALAAALAFLQKHQAASGRLYGYLHATWLAASAFTLAGLAYAESAQQALAAMQNWPLEDWVDSAPWALSCFARAGLGRRHPLIEKCLAELACRQRPDGSWSSEDGDAFAVNSTVDTLKALAAYGLVNKAQKC